MDLGDDEVLLWILSGILTLFTVTGWVRAMRLSFQWNRCRGAIVLFTPLVCLAFVLAVLRLWADDEVRASAIYIFILLLLGAGWLGIATFLFRWLGVSLREDAAERNNRAALTAWCGGIAGITLVFAGGNVGEGPSLWNNVFSALVGTGGIVVSWFVLDALGRVSANVTVDRDLATGIRLGGFLVAVGLIFGRALAGNWDSVEGTVRDFVRQGWAALVLTIVAALLERACRPTPSRPAPFWLIYGLIPALAYLAVATIWVIRLGRW
jgi:hypothetical protein